MHVKILESLPLRALPPPPLPPPRHPLERHVVILCWVILWSYKYLDHAAVKTNVTGLSDNQPGRMNNL